MKTKNVEVGNTRTAWAVAVTKQDGQMEEIMLAIYIYDIYIDLKMLHNDSRNILQDIQLIIDRMVLDISVPRAKTNF